MVKLFDKAKDKVKKAKDKVVETAVITWEVCKDNKELAAALIMAVVSVGTAGYKTHSKKQELLDRREDKLCDIYDPDMKLHTYLDRPMTKSERLEFEKRAKKGEETYYQILDDMNLV